jgi:hypothetical protein
MHELFYQNYNRPINMLSILRVLSVLILYALSGVTSALPIVYSVDDGSAENALGGPNLTFTWSNQFNTVAGGETITEIQIAFGDTIFASGGMNGTSVTVSLWNDVNNDGSPLDAVLLASLGGTIANADTNTFESFDILDTLIDDSFFVGATYTTPVGAGAFPAGIDLSLDAGVSWFTSGSDIAQSTPTPAWGFHGNWLIRAVSDTSPVPVPATIALFGIGLAGLGWSRRKKA